jgi:hypothetical protein
MITVMVVYSADSNVVPLPVILLHLKNNEHCDGGNDDSNAVYSACDNSSSLPSTNRRRPRNIIWFNPPFCKTVRNFLQLIDKHFPSTNPLHKVFNRATQSKFATPAWRMSKSLYPDITIAC